jgi:protein-disulfide isomerase
LVAAICLAAAASVAGARPADDAAVIRQELDALRQGQAAIARDVADIKQLLESLRPPPPVRPLDGTVAIGDGPSQGSPDAPVILIEFSDYQCPYCKRQVDATLPLIIERYVATGKVRYVFKDFPLEALHPQALRAAAAAHCAGDQGRYWEYHDALFGDQATLAEEDLMRHARALGLDQSRFRNCLDSGTHVQRIRASIALGTELGVTATPAVVLGRRDGAEVRDLHLIVGSLPPEVFMETIEKLLSGQPGQSTDGD